MPLALTITDHSNLLARSFHVVKACLSFIVIVGSRLALSGTDMIIP